MRGLKGTVRRWYNEEFHYLYSSLNIVPVMKSRKTRWAGHAARTVKNRCRQSFGGILRERDNFEGLGVDMSVILK